MFDLDTIRWMNEQACIALRQGLLPPRSLSVSIGIPIIKDRRLQLTTKQSKKKNGGTKNRKKR